MYTTIQSRINAIRNLPICEISKTQPMLVDLLVDIVNHETENGKLTNGALGLYSQDYWQTLSTMTRDAGFKRLGNGHFSAAYSHEMLPGKVIKVGFKKEDSGAAYVAFCRMHQGRAGIPVIHAVARHASCYTVVMDELMGLDTVCAEHEDKTEGVYAHMSAAVECSDSGWSTHVLLCDDHEERILQDNAELFETCRMVYKFFSGIASFDMHRGNVMVDKHGNCVLTDPVSFSHDRDREQGFPIDPEELLVEIEAKLNEKRVNAAIRRNAKRNPELHAARKAAAKQQRRDRKNSARERRKAEAARKEHRRFCKLDSLHIINFGTTFNVKRWAEASGVAERLQADMFKIRCADIEAFMEARELHIDKVMQARLMG